MPNMHILIFVFQFFELFVTKNPKTLIAFILSHTLYLAHVFQFKKMNSFLGDPGHDCQNIGMKNIIVEFSDP